MSRHENMDIVHKNLRLLQFMASLLPFLPFCVTGVEDLDHNLRPRPWPVKWKVLKLVKRKYADFGPTPAAYLAKQHEEQVSKERLRQILNGGGSDRLVMQGGSFFFGASDERSEAWGAMQGFLVSVACHIFR
jgi:hypothetical protein